MIIFSSGEYKPLLSVENSSFCCWLKTWLKYFICLLAGINSMMISPSLCAEKLNRENRFDSLPSISWSELEKRRPTGSFRLIYAEDETLCQIILNSLNEEDYNPDVYHSSPEIYHPLPELILQTRLNLPRKLLGTHLWRTEEYEIYYTDKTGKPQKDYWYRFIGQGDANLALGLGVKESYTEHHSVPYTDFIKFRLTAFPYPWKDKLYLTMDNINGQLRPTERDQYWKNKKFRLWEKDGRYKIDPEIEYYIYRYFEELIMVGSEYYLLSTLRFPEQDKPLRIVASLFNSMRTYQRWDYAPIPPHGVCFIESIFILHGE